MCIFSGCLIIRLLDIISTNHEGRLRNNIMRTRMLFWLSALLVCLGMLTSGGAPSDASNPGLSLVGTATSAATQPAQDIRWLKVYFTDPNPPDQVDSGIDRYVVPVLDAAKVSI